MNIRKNKKFLTASLLGATVITVAGIGFSAWIVGLNRTSVNLENIPVTIDNVSEQTQFLNLVLKEGETITIADDYANRDDSIGKGIGSDSAAADLTLEFTAFEFTFPTEGATFSGLTLTPTIDDKPLSVTLSKTDDFGRAANTYTYLDLKSYTADDLSTDFNEPSTESGYNIYTKKELKVEFTWGSYFNNVSPIQYYQEKINAESDSNEKLKLMDACKTELKAMNSFFTGKSMKILAELEINFANNN